MRPFFRLLASLPLGGALCLALPPAFAQKPPAKAAARRESVAPPQGFLLKTLRRDGRETRYTLYVPPGYDAGKPWPTILFLHGAGQCGRDGLKPIAVGLGPALMLDAEHWSFLAIFPQKPEARDRWEQHTETILAILAETKRSHNVDAARLYLTGISQGGHGVWAIAARHPGIFAAIAPVCGWGDTSTAPALKQTPIWAFHGEKDEAVPLKASEEMMRAIQEAGGAPKLTVYPGAGHNCWDRAYREENLYAWFLQHRRQQ